MTPDSVFSICNTAALLGWLLLITAGKKRAVQTITGTMLPLCFAALYACLVLAQWGKSGGGFGTLSAVSELFSNRSLLLAGWIHYLAFDLFIGTWEVADAQQRGISHWLAVPALVLTFLFGPAGLLLYFAIRLLHARIAIKN